MENKRPNKTRLFVLLLAIMLTTSLRAQVNIVNNYDFSDYNNCPNALDQLYKLNDWVNPDVSTYPYENVTPDFLHTCNTSAGQFVYIPSNLWGYQYANAGNCGVAIARGMVVWKLYGRSDVWLEF